MKTSTALKLGKIGPWIDHMVDRPFKGAHRGYYYHMPWRKKNDMFDVMDNLKDKRRTAINLIKDND